jgi:hypothetical protein
MHKVIRKRIRRSDGGIDVAIDLDAVIAINRGRDAQVTRTETHSRHTTVQGEAAGSDERGATPTDPPDTQEDTP